MRFAANDINIPRQINNYPTSTIDNIIYYHEEHLKYYKELKATLQENGPDTAENFHKENFEDLCKTLKNLTFRAKRSFGENLLTKLRSNLCDLELPEEIIPYNHENNEDEAVKSYCNEL
ncbi:hypothetical protein LOTGIDRAFT_165434 [Lottia gigantea]|uniref:Uncharacterized protein n=1 Tax=Lottia gigantea TaxID=225164 RepID=V4A134_LOTGI|nr:hypothetical protein LOTGIDRAFT_165434 [Lottia gigantea]ESO88650.1 hypothetical protein LOTGIDRAFT_165434 [Lottia gigantea]